VFWQALTMTFLGEWGDRSQISTIALAADYGATFVFIGAFLVHFLFYFPNKLFLGSCSLYLFGCDWRKVLSQKDFRKDRKYLWRNFILYVWSS